MTFWQRGFIVCCYCVILFMTDAAVFGDIDPFRRVLLYLGGVGGCLLTQSLHRVEHEQ